MALFDVAFLLGHRCMDGIEEYAIRWKGCDARQDTWESATNIERSLITDFEGSHLIAPYKNARYCVAKVLETRQVGGISQSRVLWAGFPSWTSWIDDSKLQRRDHDAVRGPTDIVKGAMVQLRETEERKKQNWLAQDFKVIVHRVHHESGTFDAFPAVRGCPEWSRKRAAYSWKLEREPFASVISVIAPPSPTQIAHSKRRRTSDLESATDINLRAAGEQRPERDRKAACARRAVARAAQAAARCGSGGTPQGTRLPSQVLFERWPGVEYDEDDESDADEVEMEVTVECECEQDEGGGEGEGKERGGVALVEADQEQIMPQRVSEDAARASVEDVPVLSEDGKQGELETEAAPLPEDRSCALAI